MPCIAAVRLRKLFAGGKGRGPLTPRKMLSHFSVVFNSGTGIERRHSFGMETEKYHIFPFA